MGKYENGVLGNFGGKIGTVVGASWKGIHYMRHKGRKSRKPCTEAQLQHQAKFKFVSMFVHRFSGLLMACYPDSPVATSINQAFTDIYNKALTGGYPAFGFDYSKVLLSRGELHNAGSPAASATGGGIINFTWNDNTDGNMANANDRAVLAVYCPELEQSVYTLSGAERSAGHDQLNLVNFTGKNVETWISFITAGGKPAATSIYTGQLLVN